MFGREYVYRRTKLLIDGQLHGKKKVLMLFPGEGRTFGFGNVFKDENQEDVFINGQRKHATESASEMKHLLFYGEDVAFIGTTKCITCVGVYFEIKGNRCFCAHINVWHLGNKRLGPSDTVPRLEPITVVYDEICESITSRLERHSKEYGWTTNGPHGENDSVPGTVKMVCPFH